MNSVKFKIIQGPFMNQGWVGKHLLENLGLVLTSQQPTIYSCWTQSMDKIGIGSRSYRKMGCTEYRKILRAKPTGDLRSWSFFYVLLIGIWCSNLHSSTSSYINYVVYIKLTSHPAVASIWLNATQIETPKLGDFDSSIVFFCNKGAICEQHICPYVCIDLHFLSARIVSRNSYC